MAPAPTRVRVGGPVWSTRSWVGSLYPTGTPTRSFLEAYGQRLDTVELSASYYANPSAERVAQWCSAVPEGFRFCAKVSRGLTTHIGRSGPKPEKLSRCIDSLSAFGDRMGRALVQMPPGFAPGQIHQLERLVAGLSPHFPLAVEVRHPGWFEEGRLVAPLASLLRAHGAAAVVTDVAGRPDVRHGTLTAPAAVIRFQATERPHDRDRIDAWADRLAAWIAQGLDEVYWFVHCQPEAAGPALMSHALSALAARTGLPLRDWRDRGTQGRLL